MYRAGVYIAFLAPVQEVLHSRQLCLLCYCCSRKKPMLSANSVVTLRETIPSKSVQTCIKFVSEYWACTETVLCLGHFTKNHTGWTPRAIQGHPAEIIHRQCADNMGLCANNMQTPCRQYEDFTVMCPVGPSTFTPYTDLPEPVQRLTETVPCRVPVYSGNLFCPAHTPGFNSSLEHSSLCPV